MIRVRKILAPTDFSDLSTVGIRHALEMARDIGAEVVIYHAIDLGGKWKDRNLTPYLDMIEKTRRLMDKFIAENFANCIDLVEVCQVVEFGPPHINIVEKAAAEDVDLIVMSTHGRTGVDHLIMRSVTEKVVAQATCSVLVVPRREGRATTAQAA